MSHKDDIRKLIAIRNLHLQKLREQQASFGLYAPAHILTEIEVTEAEIEKLHTKLELLDNNVEPEVIGETSPVTKGGLPWLWVIIGSIILVVVISVIVLLTWDGGGGFIDAEATGDMAVVTTTTQQAETDTIQLADTPTPTPTKTPSPTPYQTRTLTLTPQPTNTSIPITTPVLPTLEPSSTATPESLPPMPENALAVVLGTSGQSMEFTTLKIPPFNCCGNAARRALEGLFGNDLTQTTFPFMQFLPITPEGYQVNNDGMVIYLFDLSQVSEYRFDPEKEETSLTLTDGKRVDGSNPFFLSVMGATSLGDVSIEWRQVKGIKFNPEQVKKYLDTVDGAWDYSGENPADIVLSTGEVIQLSTLVMVESTRWGTHEGINIEIGEFATQFKFVDIQSMQWKKGRLQITFRDSRKGMVEGNPSDYDPLFLGRTQDKHILFLPAGVVQSITFKP